MPAPVYQSARKRPKMMGASFEDLDDNCLSRIISHALAQSSSSEDESIYRDNRLTEQNLSLVSKRWYFLTQTLIGTYGVHKINLDKISLPRRDAAKCTKSSSITTIATGVRTAKKPEVLAPRNFGYNRQIPTATKARLPQTISSVTSLSQPAQDAHDLRLFRAIKPKLLKYKHIILEGSLPLVEYLKLIVVLDFARTERLELNVRIENAKSLPVDFTLIPEQMPYLEELTIRWSINSSIARSNALNWIIFDRATSLRKLKILLDDDSATDADNSNNQQANGDNMSSFARKPPLGSTVRQPLSIEQICNDCINSISLIAQQEPRVHPQLKSITFNRSSSNGSQSCIYTSLLRNVLLRESSIDHVDTNDGALIEHLIKSSDRICTTRVLKGLKFLTPIKNLELLAQLLRSKSLGTDSLSIKIDTIDNIEEVRLHMEEFKSLRHESSSSQISLYIKDQKFPDCEEKINSLVSLSRLADIVVYINAQQRISIDCCHLMWSVGRRLQAVDAQPGKCLFKITLHQPIGSSTRNPNHCCEITIPFGKCLQYKINTNREDPSRHREVIRALKKECYNQFVKSIRDQSGP